MQEKQLYNVYYIEEGKRCYEVTTDNFKKWLKAHNKIRVAELSIPEEADEFEVEEVELEIYDKQ